MKTSSPIEKPLIYLPWRDVFVVVDSGKAPADAYPPVCRAILDQGDRFPTGLGCLVIIPENATPPPDAARKAIEDVLDQLSTRLRCVCWVVEGSGFQGAMSRAVITGLRLFGRKAYATHVATSLQQALAWILPHLDGGIERLPQTTLAASAIARERAAQGAWSS
jgi:hypothetical protein